MAVTQKGWASTTEADSYFSDERHVSDLWDDLADNDAKNKPLNMAYNRLYYSSKYNVPAKGNETATQKVMLIKAQCELTYYLLMHLEDEDRRKGLQSQSVTDAGIVKESYSKDDLMSLPVPPFVDALLKDFKTAKAFGMVDIDRDEDESVDTEVDEF